MLSRTAFCRIALPCTALFALTAGIRAQQPQVYENSAQIQQALAEAQNQSSSARLRAEKLEVAASRATEAAEQTARRTAGLAARIQQAEAVIAINQGKLDLVEQQRKRLRGQLAAKQQPLVRLTAALQRLTRRPPILALLRPGSMRDAMHLRALLATLLPEVERRTAGLRIDIQRAQALQQQSQLALNQLRTSQTALQKQRQGLVALETRQRLASRNTGGDADREAERALALAERSRDLDTLSDAMDRAGALRQELAALPGPVLRPARPSAAQVAPATAAIATLVDLPTYIMPAQGRLVAGFGESPQGLPRSRGIALAVRQGAQVVAPSAGRIAFAGPYRGYGSIVIVEHAGGWTSLVTGLAQLDTRLGERVVAGSPLGIAGAGRPVLTLELRQKGVPVNPLEYIKAL
jgi:murein hydrolase activator